jgi:predicted acyltransferase
MVLTWERPAWVEKCSGNTLTVLSHIYIKRKHSGMSTLKFACNKFHIGFMDKAIRRLWSQALLLPLPYFCRICLPSFISPFIFLQQLRIRFQKTFPNVLVITFVAFIYAPPFPPPVILHNCALELRRGFNFLLSHLLYTSWGLDRPVIEPTWGEILRNRPYWPTQPRTQWVPGHSPG